jgi:hypothetical protein
MKGDSTMKSILLKTLIITTLVFIMSTCFCFAAEETVRSVKIKVVDAVTRQPLPGIKAYYVLTTNRPEMGCLYFFYPGSIHPPPTKTRNVIKKEVTTDEKGEVFFEAKTLQMAACYETLFWEKIVINLDADINKNWMKNLYKDKYDFYGSWMYFEGEEDFININKSYKGFFLTYETKGGKHDEDMAKDRAYRKSYEKDTLNKLDALQRATVWDGPPEEYVIELRRAGK